jgi:hypothetical protein
MADSPATSRTRIGDCLTTFMMWTVHEMLADCQLSVLVRENVNANIWETRKIKTNQ